VAFYIFKNLQQNPDCLELMMDVGLLKLIDTLLKGNIKDKEVIEDIKEVAATL
jgi:V-type H+-transporting ATPase subunit H